MTDVTERIEAVMKKYAPSGYDPASDDMTIPFAIELAEKDVEIKRLHAAIEQIAIGGYHPPSSSMARTYRLARDAERNEVYGRHESEGGIKT